MSVQHQRTLREKNAKIEELEKLVATERVKAPVSLPLDSWLCAECYGTMLQSTGRICVDCCRDSLCYTTRLDGTGRIDATMTDIFIPCTPCCLDGHHRHHKTTPYLTLKLNDLTDTDFSVITKAIESLGSGRMPQASHSVSVISVVRKVTPIIGMLRSKDCAQKTIRDYESVRDKADSLRVEMEKLAMAHEDTCRRLIADIEKIVENNALVTSGQDDGQKQDVWLGGDWDEDDGGW